MTSRAAWAAGRRRRTVASALVTTLAVLLVWVALVLPTRSDRLTLGTLLSIPLEGLVVAALALVLPRRPRQVTAVVVGVALGLVTMVKVLDMGFFEALDRPFNVVTDRGYFSPVRVLVRDAVGHVAGDVVFASAVVLAALVLVVMPLCLGRVTGLIARHRRQALGIVTALALVWSVSALSGLQFRGGAPVASVSAGRAAVAQVRAIGGAVRDEQRFDAAASVDRFGAAADDDLLTALRGKDVLIAFVESYGRVALEGSAASRPVRAALDDGTARLDAAGYSSRSAFLTSPTFGGLSWLAHSTLQSGLWVSDQVRYDRLLAGDRLSLSRLFNRAGWRTVALMPSNDSDWAEGERFYRLERIYDSRNLGYEGPSFGFAEMPDQFALSAFRSRELAASHRRPVMAQVELASSHAPWAPVPRMVAWDRLGDGSIFERIHDQAESATQLWQHSENVQAAYAHSVAYSLSSLVSFVERYGDDDLVLILLGDHQPATVVSGHGASRDVPVTIVAHDSGVVDEISGWDWQPGLLPGAGAPVWSMDAFRDRFLTAYSPRLRSVRARAVPAQP